MPFIVENIGTIVVAIILIAIVALIVWSMRKDKKNGKTCSGCLFLLSMKYSKPTEMC